MRDLQFLTKATVLGSFIFSTCALATAQEPDESKTAKKIVISFEIDDGPVRIVIKGDDVDVELDGEPIEDERVDINDNWMQIKNKSGWPVAVGNFGKMNFGFNFMDAPKMHAWLGVDLRPVSDALAGHMDLDQDQVSQIVSVTPESPAEEGGLSEHDILLQIDGDGPATGERLREVLGEKEPGDDIRLTILRRGKEEVMEIELGESPSQSFPGFSYTLNSPFTLGKGKTIYTAPDLNFAWDGANIQYKNLKQFDQSKGIYDLQSLQNAKGFNRLFWSKAKNKQDGEEDNDKDDDDAKKSGSIAVVGPENFFKKYNVTKDGKVSSFGTLLKDGDKNTYLLPEDNPFGKVIRLQDAENQSQDLAAQLAKMSAELEALKALLEKQQKQAAKKDH
jgi:hypothetical protein